MIKALMRRRRLTLTVIVVAVAGSAGLGAIAYAAIPDGSGVIHGCYKTGAGDLRVVDGTPCKNNEAPLDWSQTGPQGASGPEGPSGPSGPQGPEGSGHVYVSNPNSHSISENGDQEIVGLSGLPAGNYLVWSPVDIVGDDSGFNGTCIWRINDDVHQFVVPNSYTFIYDSADESFGRAPMVGFVTIPNDNSSLKVFCTTSSDNSPIASGQMIALKIGSVN